MRLALTRAAFPADPPAEVAHMTNVRKEKWAQIYQDILAVAEEPETSTAQRIRIRRAVALMRLREDPKSAVGIKELKDVAQVALRYYGPHAQEVRDIMQQVSEQDAAACG